MRALVTKAKGLFDKVYTKHLLAANIVASGTLLGLGDVIVQKIGRVYNKSNTQWDSARTGRMIAIGLVLGPFSHYWYFYLDKFVTRPGLHGVFQKILCDQAVAGPFFCSVFLIGSTLLEGAGLVGAKQEWKNKFLPIYMVDWAFWPAAQFLNFRFVPSRYRVLYVSFATLMWNSVLSYMKHDMNDTHEKSHEVKIRKEKVL